MRYSTGRITGVLLAAAIACFPLAAGTLPGVIPPPREISALGGNITLASPVRIIAAEVDRAAADAVAAEIRLHGGTVARATKRTGLAPAIVLGGPDDPAVRRALAEAHATAPANPESYWLGIGPRGVVVAARDAAGIFYGAQTLRQLMRKSGEPAAGARIQLPRVTVRDWPAMRFRGLSVDLGQGVVPTEQQMQRIVETCAEYKLNVVSFYVQHLLAFRSSPLLAPKSAAITPESLRRLVAFASERHVSLLPQQQTFGHLHHLLKHELYTGLGEIPHGGTLTAGDPAVYQWIDGAVREWTELLPGTLFHAGGDETWDLGKGTNKEAAAAPGGTVHLWVEHMKRVAEIARRYGRRTLFWGDVPLKSPELLAQMPHDMIAATWTYDATSRFPEFITPFRKAGLDVIVCPSVNNWSKPAPDFNVAIANTGGFVAEGQRQGAMGMLNTVWFDDGESLFDVVWYPVLYSAAASWQGANVPRAEFDAAYDWAFHRAPGNAFATAVHKLGDIHDCARRSGLVDLENYYLWLDPYTGRGPKIYARLAPQAHQIRVLAEEALTTLLANRPQARLHTDSLDTLEFAARRMDWLGMKVQCAAEISCYYQSAHDQPGNTAAVNFALGKISGVNGRVQDMRNYASEMKTEFETLWLAANRRYMLNSMLALYDRELIYWLDKSTRIAQVKIEYRLSHKLPDAATIGLAEKP
jgi:hexosaminidase